MANFVSNIITIFNTIIDFLENNEPVLSLIVNTLLTSLIIWQTFSLAKKQKKQDEELNARQEKFQKELQKRQLQLDTFDYKNEIYIALTKIGYLTAEYESYFEKTFVRDKNYNQLEIIFCAYLDILKIDTTEILTKLRQAEYFYDDKIYNVIYDVAGHFNEITGDVSKFSLYPKILTDEELDVFKMELLDDIEERSKIVNKHMEYLHSIIPRNLQIKNLYD